MEIKVVTKYVFKGKEYNSIQDVQDEIHNIIGEEVLDKINRVCELKHKDIFKLLETLCNPEVRTVLLECLNVNVMVADELRTNEDDTYILKNVLDFRFCAKNK